MQKEEWLERAECIGMNPEIFFPGTNDNKSTKIALGTCAKCEVKEECLASNIKEASGIFGGKTARQRRVFRSENFKLAINCHECGKKFEIPIRGKLCSDKCRGDRRLRQKRESNTRTQSIRRENQKLAQGHSQKEAS
jgi:WhiB family redox-sensing transcriptional regulator